MNPRFILTAAALLLGACAGLRWSGFPQPVGREPAVMPSSAAEDRLHPPPSESVTAKTPSATLAPALAPRASVVVPQAPAERRKAALFYSDLGPDSVDVSEYPAQQKFNYAIYQRTCSQCHTLARSINAPYVSVAWWEFYVLSMRVRARWHGAPLTKEEVRAVLEFLEYDSSTRKAGRAAEFEQVKSELKQRFERALDERMEELQRNAPK